MTKPHEETWKTKLDGSDPPFSYVVGPERHVLADTLEEPYARLISAAPDMARALLAIEWSASVPSECSWLCHQDGETAAGCGSCGEEKVWSCTHHKRDHGGGHLSDCALDAALRKAGVR